MDIDPTTAAETSVIENLWDTFNDNVRGLTAVFTASVSLWLYVRSNFHRRRQIALTQTIERTKYDYRRFVRLPMRKKRRKNEKSSKKIKINFGGLKYKILRNKDYRTHKAFFIIDKAGSGKTCLMEQLYYHVLRKCRRKSIFGDRLAETELQVEFSRCADWKKDCGSGEENDLERLFGKENKADYLFIEGLDEAPYDIKKTVEQLNELLVKNCRNQAGHYRTVIVSMRVPVWEAFEEEIGKGARVGGVYDRIPYYVEFDLFDENDTQTREILKEESSRLRKHANPKREKLKGLPKLLNTIRLARRIFWKHVRWAKKVESNVTPPSRPRKASRQLTKLLWRERENSLWCIPFYAANADALLEKDFARGNHAERMAAIVRQRFKGEANKIYDDTEEWEQLQQKVEPYILAIAQRMFEQNTLAIETKDLSADNLHNEAENYPKAAPDKDLFNHITMFLRSRGERTPFDHLTLREYFVVQSVVGRWKKENLGAVKTVNDLDNYLKEDALLNEARASRRAELRNYFLDKYELTLGRKTIKKSEFIDGEWTNLYLNFGKLDWIVLDIDKENDRALLLSKDIVEERAYNNEKNEDTTWEECSLQTYLNGEFLESLGHDKKWVLRTHNENPDNTWGRLKGEQLNTPGGNTTEDYIFLLSVPEVLKYFPGLKLNKDEDGDEWHYEFDERLLAKFNGDKATWWLRSPGSSNYKAVFVLDSGHCVTLGDSVVNPYVGVRPALWLNLKSESS